MGSSAKTLAEPISLDHVPYALELQGQLGTSILPIPLPIPLGSDTKPIETTPCVAGVICARTRTPWDTDAEAPAPALMGDAPAF